MSVLWVQRIVILDVEYVDSHEGVVEWAHVDRFFCVACGLELPYSDWWLAGITIPTLIRIPRSSIGDSPSCGSVAPFGAVRPPRGAAPASCWAPLWPEGGA